MIPSLNLLPEFEHHQDEQASNDHGKRREYPTYKAFLVRVKKHPPRKDAGCAARCHHRTN